MVDIMELIRKCEWNMCLCMKSWQNDNAETEMYFTFGNDEGLLYDWDTHRTKHSDAVYCRNTWQPTKRLYICNHIWRSQADRRM